MKDFYSFSCFVLLLSILINPLTSSSCGEGCSSCKINEANEFKCEICDGYNFYFKNPQSGDCYKNFIPKCEVPSSEQLCHLCEPGYFLDITMGVCETVSDNSLVENCLRYNNNLSCVECAEEYFIDGSACSAVTDKTTNCSVYSSATECQTCKEGYFMETDADGVKSCSSFSSKSNCKKYSFGECQQCKTNYQLNKNYLLEMGVSSAMLQNRMTNNSVETILSSTEGNVCLSKEQTHCEEHSESDGNCVECMSGYFLDSKTSKCVLNPEDSITNCMKYQNAGTCIQCKKGFYLDTNQCKEATEVENCLVYETQTDQCKDCVEEYYFNGTLCIKRTNFLIPSCEKLSNNADNCADCEANHEKSSDGLNCYYKISNCSNPTVNSANDATKAAYFCQTCDSGFYPSTDGSVCLGQFVPNCSTYTTNTNDCDTCITNYFKDSSGQCVTTWLPDCVTPDPADNSRCQTCRDGFFVNGTSGQCQMYTVSNCNRDPASDVCQTCIASSPELFYKDGDKCYPYNLVGCQTYETTSNACQICASGYTSDGNGGCLIIPQPNCTTIDNDPASADYGKCTACNNTTPDEFYLNTTTNSCERLTAKNCATYTAGQNQCATCVANTFKLGNSCVKHDLIGCNTPSTTDNTCQSSQCANGFYLDTDNLCKPYTFSMDYCDTPNTAANTCTLCETTPIQTFLSNGVCLYPNLPGCKTITDATTCGACQDGYYKDGNECKLFTKLNCNDPADFTTTPLTANTCSGCPTDMSQDPDNNNCTPFIIQGCKTVTGSTPACAECYPGFFVNSDNLCSPNYLKNCIKFDANTASANCTKCDSTTYLDSTATPNACTAYSFTNFAKCLDFDPDDNKCLKCDMTQSFFLNSSGECEAYQTSPSPHLCQEFNPTADACLSCKPGYIFDGTSCASNTNNVLLDDGCLSTTDQTNGKCTTCKDGLTLVDTVFPPILYPGCVKMDADGCLLCAENYSFNNTTKTCYLTGGDTECIQMLAFTDGSSSSDRDLTNTASATVTCSKVSDPKQFYIDGSNNPLAVTAIPNCEAYTPGGGLCSACEEGFYNNTDTGNVCVQSFDSNNFVSNCLYMSATATADCYQCKEGFYLLSADNTACSNSDSDLGSCKKTATGDTDCAECKPGYELKQTISASALTPLKLRCYSSKYFLPETESLADNNNFYFKKGYRFDQLYSPNEIIEIPEDDDCERYINSDCVRCKDHNKIPKLVSENTTTGVKIFKCYNYGNTDFLVGYHLNDSNQLNPYTQLIATKVIGYAGESNFINNVAPTSPAVVENVAVCMKSLIEDLLCLDKDFDKCNECAPGYILDAEKKNCNPIPVPASGDLVHCEEMTGSVCTKCSSGYYLANTVTTNVITSQTCTKRTINNCLIYQNTKDQCKECHSGFFLSQEATDVNLKGCQPVTKTNCMEYSVFADYCLKCARGYVNNKGKCDPLEVLDCLEYYEGPQYCSTTPAGCMESFTCPLCNKQCLTCPEGFFKSDGQCFRYSVSNCLTRHPFANHCETCQPGYFLNDVLDCELASQSNCLKVHPSKNACLQCAEGTFEKDGFCYTYTVSYCEKFSPFRDQCDSCQTGYYLDAGKNCKEYTEEFCQVFHPTMDGCLSCVKDKYLDNFSCQPYTIDHCVVFHPFKNFCLICDEAFVLESSGNCVYQAIDYCELFYEHVKGCSQCQEGYYVSTDLLCLPHTVTNCEVALPSEDSCVKCKEGFYISNGKCLQYTAANCLEYNPFQNECLSCVGGFFFDDGNCSIYDLTNCALSNSYEDICSLCNEGYYLGPDKKCHKLTSVCKTSDPYYDACLTCAPDQHLDSNRHCKPNEIENCLEYVANKNECAVCDKGFWLDSGICSKYFAKNCKSLMSDQDKCDECVSEMFYKNSNGVCLPISIVANCESYNTSSNECSFCVEGYYLGTSNNCIQNPEGVQNCEKYKDSKTCMKCKGTYYLSENQCLQSSTSDVDCAEYIGDGICGKCVSSKILSFNNTCDTPNNSTCATYLDTDNCESCQTGELLKEEDGKVNCVSHDLPNCVTAKLNGSEIECELCENGYLLESGECVTPDSTIDNCLQYESQTKCSLCDTNFLLASDQESCVANNNNIESNCLYAKLNSSPGCYECDPGYKFDSSGSCVSCGGDGCDVCSPTGNTCQICAKGYYMTTELSCKAYPSSSNKVAERLGESKLNKFETSNILTVCFLFMQLFLFF